MDTSNKQPHTEKQPETSPSETSTDAVKQLQIEKKRRRSRPLLVIVLTVLLIGLGAFLAWFALDTNLFGTETDPPSDDEQQQDIARLHDASWAIEQVRTVFDGDFEDIERPLLAVQTSGNDFSTDAYDVGAYRGVSGSVPADERDLRVAEIGKVLTDDDFTANVSRSNDETSYSARYYGTDAACVVDSQGSQDNPAADHALQVACIDMSTLNDLAEQQAPLYEAAADDTNVAGAALLAAPTIEESSESGYQRASLQIAPANLPGGIGTMYFYQAPQGGWMYITTVGDTGPGGVQCDELSDDARLAYRGEVCYNDTKSSRVEL